MEIIEYHRKYEEDYIRVHNEGFAGEDSVYSGKVNRYNEEGNIMKSFLARIDNKIVGFIDIIELEEIDDAVEIDPVGVLPEYRSKGAGSMLIKRVEEWCRGEDYEKIRALVTSRADDRLHRFYMRNNFELTAQIFSNVDGKVQEIGLRESSPFPEERLKGHVYVYELNLM